MVSFSKIFKNLKKDDFTGNKIILLENIKVGKEKLVLDIQNDKLKDMKGKLIVTIERLSVEEAKKEVGFDDVEI